MSRRHDDAHYPLQGRGKRANRKGDVMSRAKYKVIDAGDRWLVVDQFYHVLKEFRYESSTRTDVYYDAFSYMEVLFSRSIEW